MAGALAVSRVGELVAHIDHAPAGSPSCGCRRAPSISVEYAMAPGSGRLRQPGRGIVGVAEDAHFGMTKICDSQAVHVTRHWLSVMTAMRLKLLAWVRENPRPRRA